MAIIEDLNTIEELVKVEDFDINTFVQDVKDTIDDQKSKYNKKDTETLKWKGAMKTLGYDREKYESLDSFVTDINGKVSKASNVDNLSTDKSALEERLALMESKLQKKEQDEIQLKKDNDRCKLEKKLSDTLNGKLKASKYIIKDLINDNKVKMVDNEVVFMDGEDVVLFEDGIQKVIQENEDLVLTDQNTGGNTKPGTKTTNNKTKLSVEAINKMSPSEIKKNISEIKKMGMRRI